MVPYDDGVGALSVEGGAQEERCDLGVHCSSIHQHWHQDESRGQTTPDRDTCWPMRGREEEVKVPPIGW